MSDSQVLEYVKDGIRQGKEQKQLASELARRGVTKEQATRVKQLYEQQNNVNASNATGTDVNESRLREEMKENTSDMLEDHPSTQDLARGNQVFGRNIFNTRNLTFEPSVNIAEWFLCEVVLEHGDPDLREFRGIRTDCLPFYVPIVIFVFFHVRIIF